MLVCNQENWSVGLTINWELFVFKGRLAPFISGINLGNSKFGMKNFSFVVFNKVDSSRFGVKEDKFLKSTIFECICFKKVFFLAKEQGSSLKF